MPTITSATGGPGSMRWGGQMVHASDIKVTPGGFQAEKFVAGQVVLTRYKFMAGKITATIATKDMTPAEAQALLVNETVDIQWLNGTKKSFKGCDVTNQPEEDLDAGTFPIEIGYEKET
ncbi:MAG TPA: phage tail tube protein [Nakamurella multipartita]|nr:phage tail tube protein [Nakamurella multipartita]